MEAMLSEFDYFTPTVIQSAIVAEYDEVIAPTNAINPDTATGFGTIEFNITGASDLYRDLNNSYLMIKVKLVATDGSAVAGTLAAAPVNLPLHSLFATVTATLCGKEITSNDTLYPYRAYLETPLSYDRDVPNTRLHNEGWAKDKQGVMESLYLATDETKNPKQYHNPGFLARQKMVLASRELVLIGRPHLDMFHQPLDLPPNCGMTLKFTPASRTFSLMEATGGSDKFVLLEAKLYVRTKKVAPELVLAHREMLNKANMRFPMNRVTVTRHSIAAGFKSIDIPLNFPAKLPKRLFLTFVANTACAGALNENPFNFKNFGVEKLMVHVNGVNMPSDGLTIDYANNNCQRAYLNTLATLGIDNENKAIDLSLEEFAGGFAIYGFKIAPGPLDGQVLTAANSVGNITVSLTFATAPIVTVDMIVYAETPSFLEIDKVSSVTIV